MDTSLKPLSANYKGYSFDELEKTHSYFLTLKWKLINIFFGDVITTSSDRDYDLAYIPELMTLFHAKTKKEEIIHCKKDFEVYYD